MADVVVSERFRIEIPREIRAEMSIRAGQKMRVIRRGNKIELFPARTIAEMKGAFPGLSSEGVREEDDRF